MDFPKKVQDKVKDLLLKKGNSIVDEDVHDLAEEMKVNVHELEAYIYKLAYKQLANEALAMLTFGEFASKG